VYFYSRACSHFQLGFFLFFHAVFAMILQRKNYVLQLTKEIMALIGGERGESKDVKGDVIPKKLK